MTITDEPYKFKEKMGAIEKIVLWLIGALPPKPKPKFAYRKECGCPTWMPDNVHHLYLCREFGKRREDE